MKRIQLGLLCLPLALAACAAPPSSPQPIAGATALATAHATAHAKAPTTVPSSKSTALKCDDSIKSAFKPDALTSVLAVLPYAKGDKVFVSDSPTPVTLSADLCLVKLKVGPGNPGPADARSTSEGIGIEIWLPSHAAWNQRIRNYGGGGFVGGGHLLTQHAGATLALAVGSKFPALVIAGMGYVSGTTDAGQRWSQNGSFVFLPDGRLNETLLKDFSYRSLVEQALKTRALTRAYCGSDALYAYFDGHSTGGRQGWKVAQDYPEFYDGYLLAAPAISSSKFGLSAFYAQLVLKAELGFTSADPAFAASNFSKKIAEANRRAVLACDKESLGFLLNPFACSYSPTLDASALCVGVQGHGVTGSNADPQTCVNGAEARAIARLWYGMTSDGSVDNAETERGRSGVALGAQQLWWTFPRGANWGALVSSVSNAERIAAVMQDVRYAPSKQVSPAADFVNASTPVRDKWREVDQASWLNVYNQAQTLEASNGQLNSDSADLARLRQLGRKIITYTGLAEDAIAPATSVHHFERVAAAMGGVKPAQEHVRLYLVPGKAHSSQGRAYVVASAADPTRNNSVPLPALPGSGNQSPSREQDQMFSALTDWVERGQTPGAITVTSRDRSVSYPLCVYPLKITWDGVGSAKLAASFSCR